MKKEVVSVFDGEIKRKSTFAEKIGKLIFWIVTISLFLFLSLSLWTWIGKLMK